MDRYTNITPECFLYYILKENTVQLSVWKTKGAENAGSALHWFRTILLAIQNQGFTYW